MGQRAASSPRRPSRSPGVDEARVVSTQVIEPGHRARSSRPRRRSVMYEFPRARRIRRRSEFVRIQNAPSARVPTRHLLMLLRPRESAGPARLGVVASKKVGGSVVRNRTKRLVREAFRKNPDAFPDDLDVVIILRPGAHLLPAGELEAQVRQAKSALHRRAAELAAAGSLAGSRAPC